MSLIKQLDEQFGVKNLYEVFGLEKDADKSSIKKAYRNLSLKHHPDKFQNCGDSKVIENQTTKFQLLAKVHKILSDDEARKLYDEQGMILDDENMDNADWEAYWRLLFPKITTKDIDDYMKKYIGSEEEIEDLKRIYSKCKGDMNKIYDHMIGFEEDRTRKMLNDLIDAGDLEALPKFVNESKSSIEKRKRKIMKEAEECEQSKEDDELAKMILMRQSQRENNFDSMIANLEAKYAGNASKKQKTQKSKRK